MENFEIRLNKALELRRMTPAELCRRIGCSEGTMSNYRSGAYKPRQKRLEQIASALDVPVAWLMGADVPLGSRTVKSIGDFRPAAPARQVPVLGSIRCGEPTDAVQLSGETAPAPGEISCDYVFNAVGDSMIGAGIHDGDLVYIRAQPEVENGQIAAVQLIVDGEYTSTLKRYYRAGDQIVLQPENPAYPPQVYTRDKVNEVQIIGLAVYVLSNLA